MTTLAFVVLSYNSFEDATRLGVRLLEAIDGSDHLLILVDNASPCRKGYRAWSALEGRNVHRIELPDNRGYSYGNNAGIDYALACGIDNVVILNPDVHIADVSVFVRDVSYHFERDQFLCIGFTVRGVSPYFAKVSLLNVLFPVLFRLMDRVRYQCRRMTRPNGAASAVGRVYGCAFGLRGHGFRSLGLFDDRVFLYCEELIVSIVASRAKQRILLSHRVAVDHATSGSLGGRFTRFTFSAMSRSTAHIAREYFGLPSGIAAWVGFLSACQIGASRVVALWLQALRAWTRGKSLPSREML